MNKPAVTSVPIHDLIQRRWSPFSFSDRPVSRLLVLKLLEAARWAPSARNEQPWRFIVASREEPEEYQRLLECLVASNQRWAATAPLLMVSVARLKYSDRDTVNATALYDTGLAVTNLILEAMANDLFVHQMGGVHFDKVRERYAIPEVFQPVAGIAIGYLGDAQALPDDLQARHLGKRMRRPVEEIAFSGNWGSHYFRDSEPGRIATEFADAPD